MGWLLFFVAAVLVSGCRSERRRVPTIAVISMTGGQLYWEDFQRATMPLAARYGYRLTFAAPQSEADYELQAGMVENAIATHVDGIIVAPSHQLVLASIIRRAGEQHIAVVVAGAPIALAPQEYAAYIGLENKQAGLLAADRLIALLHGQGSVAVIGVSPTLEASSTREEAFADEIAANSRIKIVSVKYSLSDWARARQATLDTLQEHSVQGIFTSDEFSTLGALSAIRGLAARPKFVGVGQEPDTVAGVRDGKIDAIVVSNPQLLGERAMLAMHRVLTHQPLQKRQMMPFKLLDASSLDDADIRATQ